jgi:hypothetical protein
MNRLLCLAALALPGVASAGPDFRVDSMVPSCAYGYMPRVTVTVTNTGNAAGATFVDVFIGRPAPPELGEWGDVYVYTNNIGPGQTRSYTLDLFDAPSSYVWLDALLDTGEYFAETNELDNWGEVYANFTNCFIP